MNSYNKFTYPYRYNKYSNGDRFFGGGIILPFILGGIAGSALSRPYPYPYPYPVPYPINYYPYQYPITNNYY